MSNDKKVIPLHDPDFKGGGGTVGFMGWRRLEQALKATGEIDPNERIAGYVIEDTGINFYIEKT